MKYEVGKAYIHDGSAECPLPDGSIIRAVTNAASLRSRPADQVNWPGVLCFVPTHIPPQPIERWAVADSDGFFCTVSSKERAIEVASFDDGRRVVLLREVAE